MNDNWPVWLIDYQFEGAIFTLKVPARTREEAMARLGRAAEYGTVIGELYLSIPAHKLTIPFLTIFANLFVGFKNRFKEPK